MYGKEYELYMYHSEALQARNNDKSESGEPEEMYGGC
jgi:hypothetical protein